MLCAVRVLGGFLSCRPYVQVLDRWEERLEAIFEGRPYDEFDAALTDTCANFPLDI